MNISIEKFCSMIQPQENKEYFDIPTIQRGFVWKPHQIEDLWDSLARNFPIGTFIIDDTTNNKQILDGQQRASAIAIGYNINSFNLNNDFRRLFIDIAKPDQETDKKFTFRIITRSHPWGYQLKNNEKTLTVTDRRNAIEVFEEKGIIKNEKYYNVKEKNKFFPYDCCVPVPVELFLHESLENLQKWIEKTYGTYITIEGNKIKINLKYFSKFYKDKISESNKEVISQGSSLPTKGLLAIYETIYKNYKDKYKSNECNEEEFYQRVVTIIDEFNNNLFYTINKLHESIQNIKSYQLVFSNLTNSKLKFADNIAEDDKERIINEEEKTEDIEIIFQRLNRGGTPISEDDLTYSLFKSSFGESDEKRKILDSFNVSCKGLINPSRLFRLAYLLWQQYERLESNKSNQYELVTQRIDYKLAQKNFNKDEFKVFLKNHFIKNSQDNYFENFKEIFLYNNDTNKNGLPYPLFIQLCKSAPELVFLMMYRLNIIKDYVQVKNDLEKRNLMIGFLLGLYWFFKGKRGNYQTLLRTIWSLVSFSTFEDCWSTELLQRCNLMYDNYNVIDNYIFNKLNKDNRLYEEKKGEKRGEYKEEEKYLNTFREKILYNKELVLYAQRDYLNEMFMKEDNSNNIFSLEDNSVPYDYDHICPSSYRKSKYINRDIKNLLDHIGNFRVWPFDLNRADQDTSISDKFKYDKTKLIFNNYHIDSQAKIKEYSFVTWTNIDNYTFENLCKKVKVREVLRLCDAIMLRSNSIYNKWFSLIKRIFNKNEIDNRLKYNYDEMVDTLNNIIRNNNKYNYIWISSNDEEQIKNDNIIVSICKNKVMNEDEVEKSYEREFKFTLPSYSQASFEHLCNEIVQTIEEYEKKKSAKK